MSFYRLFRILVVWVPAYAHHHLMNISISNAGPTIVDASGHISWEVIYYMFGKVSCGDAQLLGAAAEAPHHLSAAEVRQVPHGAVLSGCGLRPVLRVPRGLRRDGARVPTPAGRRGRERPTARACRCTAD